MKMKLNIYILLLFIVISNLLIAGCGGCQINNDLSEKTSSSTFIDTVPNDGKIDGFVIASCNKCNLGNISDRKCRQMERSSARGVRKVQNEDLDNVRKEKKIRKTKRKIEKKNKTKKK